MATNVHVMTCHGWLASRAGTQLPYSLIISTKHNPGSFVYSESMIDEEAKLNQAWKLTV